LFVLAKRLIGKTSEFVIGWEWDLRNTMRKHCPPPTR